MSLARFASFAAATAVALTVVVTSTVRPADAGLTKALKCSFDKQRAAVRRAEALLDCRREALRANALIDAACVDRAMERFDAIFQKIEARGGCAIEGDAPLVEEMVERFTRQLETQLQGSCAVQGDSCGGAAAPCCTGLVCRAIVGQPAFCGP